MNYAIIPWKRFDDFIVGEQIEDIFPYKSSHGLVLGVVYFTGIVKSTTPFVHATTHVIWDFVRDAREHR